MSICALKSPVRNSFPLLFCFPWSIIQLSEHLKKRIILILIIHKSYGVCLQCFTDEIFLKTAEIGNITKTAEILHYTQAGISHAIAALEKETVFSLLARSASGVTLTENGKRLLPYIQTLVNDQHGLSQAIYDINETVAGTLRIATFTSVSTQWLPTIIRKFQADYPLVEFDLLAGDYDEITERILKAAAWTAAF